MDWKTLADRGPVDNAFVRLTDVELDQTDPLEAFEGMFGDFDPEANLDPEQALAEFVQAMDEVDPMKMVEMAVAPVKVIPKGADKETVAEAIVIPRVERFINEAQRQLEETGTLSGYVSTYQGDEFMRAIVAYAGGKEVLNELDELGLGKQKIYTIEPMAEALDRADAGSNFWLCGFGLAIGLILCGSGGPSLATCVFFPVPSVISVLGYPMRYGRGQNVTRIVYLVIGAGLLSYGYNLLILQGGFGQIGGDPVFHSLGFISTFVGIAAMLAVPAQIIARKVDASMDVAPSPKHEVKMSVTDACSLVPLDAAETVYQDRQLVPSPIAEFSDELRQRCEALTTVGFEPAETMHWTDDEASCPAAIQIGCQNMVVSDMEESDGRVQSRMVSMLHDGMTVVTLSPSVNVAADRRVGSNGVYLRSRSDDPEQMLAEHLEQTISIAEKRDTSVVTFDGDETQHIYHLSRRVLADIQYQYGESTIEVESASYGRFQYPMRPVADAAAV